MTGRDKLDDVLAYAHARRRFLTHCAQCPEHCDAEDVRLLVRLADETVDAARISRTWAVAVVLVVALICAATLIHTAITQP